MKESREYVGREMMFGRLDNLPNWDCMGLTTESFGLTRSLNDGMEANDCSPDAPVGYAGAGYGA